MVFSPTASRRAASVSEPATARAGASASMRAADTSSVKPRPPADFTGSVQARAARLQSPSASSGARDDVDHLALFHAAHLAATGCAPPPARAARPASWTPRTSRHPAVRCRPRARSRQRSRAAAAGRRFVRRRLRAASSWSPPTATGAVNPPAAGASQLASKVSAACGAHSWRQRRAAAPIRSSNAARRRSPEEQQGLRLHRPSCMESSCCSISLATEVICELAW